MAQHTGMHQLQQHALDPIGMLIDVFHEQNAAIDLRLVFNEEEESRVLKDAEPLLIEDDTVHFHAAVEEEVLLVLPYAARCERDDCAPS